MSTVTLPRSKKSIVRAKTIFLGYSGQIKQIEVSTKTIYGKIRKKNLVNPLLLIKLNCHATRTYSTINAFLSGFLFKCNIYEVPASLYVVPDQLLLKHCNVCCHNWTMTFITTIERVVMNEYSSHYGQNSKGLWT